MVTKLKVFLTIDIDELAQEIKYPNEVDTLATRETWNLHKTCLGSS